MVNSMEILKTIPYSEFYMWDVKRYNYVFNNSFENAVFLRDILIPFKQSVSKEELVKNKWRIIQKINFQGELFLRDISEINSYKGEVYKVPENSIIYSKINVRHGCVYYHKKGKTPFAVSSEYPTFIFDITKVNGYYLKLILRSNEFKKLLNTKTSGISKARVKVNEFLDIRIPLPPVAEQNRIVTNYNAKIKLAQEQEEKAKQLEQEIENYLFEVLGIEKLEEKEEKKVLNWVNFSNLNIWGVDRLLRGNFKSVLTSSIYPNKKLNTLVYVNPRTDLTNLDNEDEMSFIPMKYISDDYGIVLSTEKGMKCNSKGYTKFKDGDLLWARITPCMQNGKSAIVSDLLNGYGYGSTEYHVLREKESNFKLDFLYHLLRSKAIREDAVNHFTGSAGQQRVPKTYLENLTIPLPPLETQTQIANHISALKQQIKDLQSQAKENREKAIQEFEEKIFTKS